MAAPHNSVKENNPLRPLQRGRHFALPKSHCSNRSEWRVLPGKPPERLSPHYYLGCEFGSPLMMSWRNDGSEPIYLCEKHAKEFGYPAGVRARADSRADEAGKRKENETSAGARPVAVPQPFPVPAKAANSTSEAHCKATRPAQSPAERCAAIHRLIGELATQLEQVFSQSEATISVADTIDTPLERAAAGIIADHAMTETQKDAAVQQLGVLQESLKQDVAQEITPLEAHRIKQTVGNCLSGKIHVADEAKPGYRAVYDSLENAIHAAAPKAKHLEERLAHLLKIKAELESFSQAQESAPASS
jgi:hypothetical protein